MARLAWLAFAGVGLGAGCFYDWESPTKPAGAGAGGGSAAAGGSGASGASGGGGGNGGHAGSTASAGGDVTPSCLEVACAPGTFCDVQSCDANTPAACTPHGLVKCDDELGLACTCDGWFPSDCFAKLDGRATIEAAACPHRYGQFPCGASQCTMGQDRCVFLQGSGGVDDELYCEPLSTMNACPVMQTADVALQYVHCVP